jgi:hypothetical protein
MSNFILVTGAAGGSQGSTGKGVVRLLNAPPVEVDEFETGDPALRGVSPTDNEIGWRIALATLATLVEAGYKKNPARSAAPTARNLE